MFQEIKLRIISLKPFKGIGGRILLDDARMTPEGIETIDGQLRDHDFVLADEEVNTEGAHPFVHQRGESTTAQEQERLVHIQPKYLAETLYLTWKGERGEEQDAIEVPLDSVFGRIIPVKIWNDTCWGVDQGDALADWVSERLHRRVRVVRANGPGFFRAARQNYRPNSNTLRWHDGYPVHAVSLEDVKWVEQEAGVVLGWERYGPQFVFEHLPPGAIHTILNMMIGEVPAENAKPCTRCPIPLRNQDTGERGVEPNKTLRQHRIWVDQDENLQLIFGENINPLARGIVHVGDTIEVVKFRDPPIEYGSAKEMRLKLLRRRQ